MCGDGQENLRNEADVRLMLHHQEELLNAIRYQTDTNQRIAADLKKLSLVSVLFDNLEQHMTSCDSRNTSTLTDIGKSNWTMSQKINNFLDERLTSLQNDMALLTKNAESLSSSLTHFSKESKLREILDEVKFLAASISIGKINASDDVLPYQKTL